MRKIQFNNRIEFQRKCRESTGAAGALATPEAYYWDWDSSYYEVPAMADWLNGRSYQFLPRRKAGIQNDTIYVVRARLHPTKKLDRKFLWRENPIKFKRQSLFDWTKRKLKVETTIL